MGQFPSAQTERRGISVDDHMRLKGAEDVIFALGDCTATPYAATAQSAAQQGKWLGKRFNQMARVGDLRAQLEDAQKNGQTDQVKTLERMVEKAERIKPFHYSHSGALAYIGHDKAIADLPFMNGGVSVGGVATYLAWRGVYFTVSGRKIEKRMRWAYIPLSLLTVLLAFCSCLSLPLPLCCRNSSRCATDSTSQWTGPR